MSKRWNLFVKESTKKNSYKEYVKGERLIINVTRLTYDANRCKCFSRPSETSALSNCPLFNIYMLRWQQEIGIKDSPRGFQFVFDFYIHRQWMERRYYICLRFASKNPINFPNKHKIQVCLSVHLTAHSHYAINCNVTCNSGKIVERKLMEIHR